MAKSARATSQRAETTEVALRNDPRARTTAPPAVRAAPAPRRRPDPRPMRLALAGGGAAALSALLALIGAAALPTTAAVPTAPDPAAGGANDIAQVRHVVRYVVLAPGQLPPAGVATTPSTVVAAPVAAPQPRAKPAIVTSQSGRP